MAEEVCSHAAKCRARPKEDQQIEPEDGRRQEDGECGEGFDQRAQTGACRGKPVRERDAESEQHGGGCGRQTQGKPESLKVHSVNGLEAFGGEGVPRCGLGEKVKEAVSGSGARAPADDDGSLEDRRIVLRRDADEAAIRAEARGKSRGEGDESDLGVARVDVLRRLSDVFGDDEFGSELVIEAAVLESSLGRAAVGSVQGVSDRNGFDS